MIASANCVYVDGLMLICVLGLINKRDLVTKRGETLPLGQRRENKSCPRSCETVQIPQTFLYVYPKTCLSLLCNYRSGSKATFAVSGSHFKYGVKTCPQFPKLPRATTCPRFITMAPDRVHVEPSVSANL